MEGVPGLETIIAAVPAIAVLIAWISDLRNRNATLTDERDEMRRQLVEALKESASLRSSVMLLEARLGSRLSGLEDRTPTRQVLTAEQREQLRQEYEASLEA
jgi:FtsZ-binding cell division protein ZapB